MPDQQSNPIKHDEETQDLERVEAMGQAMFQMVQTEAWQKQIAPRYTERLGQLHVEFLKAKTYEDFVRIQQLSLAIQGLLGKVAATIQAGEVASDQLAEKKSK